MYGLSPSYSVFFKNLLKKIFLQNFSKINIFLRIKSFLSECDASIKIVWIKFKTFPEICSASEIFCEMSFSWLNIQQKLGERVRKDGGETLEGKMAGKYGGKICWGKMAEKDGEK